MVPILRSTSPTGPFRGHKPGNRVKAAPCILGGDKWHQSEAGEQVCLGFEGGIEKQVTQEVQGCHTSVSAGCWRSGSPGCCFGSALGHSQYMRESEYGKKG